MTAWNWIRLAPVALASLVSLSLTGPTSQVAAKSALVQEDETLVWLDDYDEALALAKKTGRPLLLEFRCAP